ncbi:MAG TPA: Npt1/Npt2 family nucleotide transporter [Byssovorax sp.]
MTEAAPAKPDDRAGLSTLERCLGVVTDVRAGEGPTALLLTLNIFLVLCAYYLIKPVREALIGAVPNGPFYKSYMGAGIAVTLFFAVPAYARVAERLARNKLIAWVSGFFAANLVGFYVLGKTPWVETQLGATLYGLGFLLWVGVFNMMIVAQFWSFAADVYTEERGKRIFPLVAVGASLGAMAGSEVVSRIVSTFGILQMMLLSAGMLVGSALVAQVVHVRAEKERLDGGEEPPASDRGDKKDTKGAYALVFGNKYLLLIAAFTLLFTLVNTSGEFMISSLVAEAAKAHTHVKSEQHAFIAAYFGDYFKYVNAAGLFIQLFLVSRLVKYGGFKVAFLVFPVVSLVSSTVIATTPTLPVVRVGKTAENSLDYSLNNTLRNMLWLPTTRRMKYLAKQVVDSFFSRLGDVGSAAGVLVLADHFGLGVRGVAILNVVLVVVWIVVALRIVVERDRVSKEYAEREGHSCDAPEGGDAAPSKA